MIVHGRAETRGRAALHGHLVEAYRQKYRGKHDTEYLLDTDYAAEVLAFEVVPTKAMTWLVEALEDWTIRRWRP